MAMMTMISTTMTKMLAITEPNIAPSTLGVPTRTLDAAEIPHHVVMYVYSKL